MSAGADGLTRCGRITALFEVPQHPMAGVALDVRLGANGAVAVLTRREYDADGQERRCRLELLDTARQIASAIAACEDLDLHDLGEDLLTCGVFLGFDPRALDAEACRLAGVPSPDDPAAASPTLLPPSVELPLASSSPPACGGREA